MDNIIAQVSMTKNHTSTISLNSTLTKIGSSRIFDWPIDGNPNIKHQEDKVDHDHNPLMNGSRVGIVPNKVDDSQKEHLVEEYFHIEKIVHASPNIMQNVN